MSMDYIYIYINFFWKTTKYCAHETIWSDIINNENLWYSNICYHGFSTVLFEQKLSIYPVVQDLFFNSRKLYSYSADK